MEWIIFIWLIFLSICNLFNNVDEEELEEKIIERARRYTDFSVKHNTALLDVSITTNINKSNIHNLKQRIEKLEPPVDMTKKEIEDKLDIKINIVEEE